MQFKKISINGISYGENEDVDHASYITDEELASYPSVTNVNFRDKELI